jgi:hypothetical protein
MDWTIYWFMFSSLDLRRDRRDADRNPDFHRRLSLAWARISAPRRRVHRDPPIRAVFGFSSGFVGYYRKSLIDFRSALPFILVAVPVAILGAPMLAVLKEQESLLKAACAALMLILCPIVLWRSRPASAAPAGDDTETGSADRTGASRPVGRGVSLPCPPIWASSAARSAPGCRGRSRSGHWK